MNHRLPDANIVPNHEWHKPQKNTHECGRLRTQSGSYGLQRTRPQHSGGKQPERRITVIVYSGRQLRDYDRQGSSEQPFFEEVSTLFQFWFRTTMSFGTTSTEVGEQAGGRKWSPKLSQERQKNGQVSLNHGKAVA